MHRVLCTARFALLGIAVIAATAATAVADVAVTTDGGIEVTTYDGSAWFKLGGRIMIDGGFYAEDEVVLGDGTELRRARIDLEGGVAQNWDFELSADFADATADVKDAALSYSGFGATTITIGQQKIPFSLEELTSSKHTTFLEPGLLNELVPGRKLGISAKHHRPSWTAAAGVYGEAFDANADDEGNEGWLVAGRATLAPVHDDRHAVHLGVHAALETPDSERKVKYNARPESHVTDVKYLDTGKIKRVEDTLTWGLDGAVVMGPFSLQVEYAVATVSQEAEDESRASGEEYEFSGWYAYASWFVTGESRDYKVGKGAFGSVKPYGDRGALELSARYSTLDLNDCGVEGGEETNITLGASWYANKNIRITANYIIVDNDEHADADGDVVGDDDPHIFGVRCQIGF